MGGLGRVAEEGVQGLSERRHGLEGRQAQRIDQHQMLELRGPGGREAGRDGTAEGMPDKGRG